MLPRLRLPSNNELFSFVASCNSLVGATIITDWCQRVGQKEWIQTTRTWTVWAFVGVVRAVVKTIAPQRGMQASLKVVTHEVSIQTAIIRAFVPCINIQHHHHQHHRHRHRHHHY